MNINRRSELGNHEVALLELIRMQPISYFPPRYLELAYGLAERGLLRRDGEMWFPTRTGLARIGVTLH